MPFVKVYFFCYNFNMQKQDLGQIDQEIKVSNDVSKLEQYQDLSGVTIKKLNFGLWWILNIKFFKKAIFWFIVVLGIIGWLYTFISFGHYMTIGSNKDDQMIKNMVVPNLNKVAAPAPIPLQLGEVEILPSFGGGYDFLAVISNANPQFYAEFDYSFVINGSSSPIQKDFVLPGEQKKIVLLGLKWIDSIRLANLSLSNIKWQRIDRHQIADWELFKKQHLSFDISEPEFTSSDASGLSEKINMSEITFNFNNSTAFNYYHIPLNVFIYSFGRVMGIYQTSVEKIESGESRKFELNYSGSLDRADRVEVVPDLNILMPDIYFKAN